MAQENTAVNALIARTQNKPLEPSDEADDLFADPSKGARKTTAAPVQQSRAPSRATVQGHALPPPYRKSGTMDAQGTPAPQILRPAQLHEVAEARPSEPIEEGDHTPLPPPMVPQTEPIERTPLPSALKGLGLSRPNPAGERDEDAWFDKSVPVELETYVGPEDDIQPPAKSRAIWWVAGAFTLGLGVAAVLFWPGRGTTTAKKDAPQAAAAPAPAAEPAPTPVAVAAPTPAPTPAPVVESIPVPAVAAVPEPVVAPVIEPVAAVAPTTVTIRFDSVPTGASVVLVEDGQTIALGIAPVEREIDPTHHNEVMFTLEGHSSVILPVDTRLTNVTAKLAGPKAAAVEQVAVAAVEPEPAPAVAPVKEPVKEKKVVAVKAAPKKEPAPKREARTPEPKPRKPVADVGSGGDGVLMIASKPPCEILVDGKKTGLTTPQRSLSLPAGKHKVTLVNKEHDIKESFSVTIKSSQSVRVVKDLTGKM